MSTIHILETLPGILSQFTSDLAERVDCLWAVVVTRVGSQFLPLYIYGEPPSLDLCLSSLSAALSGEPEPPSPCVPQIVCPIRIAGEDLALIAFGPSKGGKPYAQGDRDLIVKLAAHVSALIGTREELASARHFQQHFPGRLQPIRGLDYYGECREAGEVGADFFDFIAPDRCCLLLSIGDVSAKGISSAIVMAGLQASLRALGPGSRNRISTLVRDLNRVVCQLSPDRFYTTMFYALVDSARRELHYVNAGHEPPLIVRKRNNAVVELRATGTVLGLSPRTAYEQRTIPLEPGDVLVAVTEGVADALCARGPGAHRQVVIEAVREHPGASSSEVAARIIGSVEAAQDDRAVVVVRLLETGVVELIDKRRAFHHEPAGARERLEPLLA